MRRCEAPGEQLDASDAGAVEAAARAYGVEVVANAVDPRFPGLAQVFAASAAEHLFDEVHEVNIRVGGDLRIEGVPFGTVLRPPR